MSNPTIWYEVISTGDLVEVTITLTSLVGISGCEPMSADVKAGALTQWYYCQQNV